MDNNNICLHIEREVRKNKEICLACGKVLMSVKGTEISVIPINRPGGIEFKSKGTNHENQWMQRE